MSFLPEFSWQIFYWAPKIQKKVCTVTKFFAVLDFSLNLTHLVLALPTLSLIFLIGVVHEFFSTGCSLQYDRK